MDLWTRASGKVAGTSQLAGLMVGLLLVCVPLRSSAQERPFEELVAEGVEEFNAGRFPEARALLLQADSLKSTARTQRALGMVEFDLRNYLAAVRYLRNALMHPLDQLTTKQRTDVDRLIVRALAFLGQFELRPSSKGVRVLLEGEVLEERPMLVPIGSHELQFERPNCPPSFLTVEVKGGERQSVRLPECSTASTVRGMASSGSDTASSLRSAEQTPSTPSARPKRFARPAPSSVFSHAGDEAHDGESGQENEWLAPLGFYIGAIAAGALGASGVFATLAYLKRGELEENYWAEDQEELDRYARNFHITLGVGLGTAALSGLCFVLSAVLDDSKSEAESARPIGAGTSARPFVWRF